MGPSPKGILLGMLLLVATGPGIERGRADDHGKSKRSIAFVSNRTGSSEIFVMNDDGSNAVNLTNNPSSPDQWPTWSPDGTKIAFVRGRGFGRELFVMNADGTNQTQLTTNTVAEIMTAWSPDGRKIAVVRFGPDFNTDIWLISAHGTEPELRLTDDPGFDGGPDWSPNGRWIAFSSNREGFFAAYKVRADGSGHLSRLTPPEMEAGSPSWSPDGEKIAFEDNICGDCPESDLWVLDLEDGELKQLTDTPENELWPDWSPDGERIVYERAPIVNDELLPPDIFVVDAEGGTPANLTSSPDVVDSTAKYAPKPGHEKHEKEEE